MAFDIDFPTGFVLGIEYMPPLDEIPFSAFIIHLGIFRLMWVKEHQ